MLKAPEYNKLIQEIETTNSKQQTKSSLEYNLLNSYEVWTIADTKKIIRKRTEKQPEIKYLVPYEDLFDSILRCNKNVGHKGRDIMLGECSKEHLNLTNILISRNNNQLINLYSLNNNTSS